MALHVDMYPQQLYKGDFCQVLSSMWSVAFSEDRDWIWQLSGAPGRASEDGMLSPTPAP